MNRRGQSPPYERSLAETARGCARKVLTLVVLLCALGFLMYDNSIAPVKAYDDCNAAFSNLEACYYSCTVQCGGIQGCQSCYNDCEMAHTMYGTTCSMPHYSPMMSPVWQQRYLDQLVLQNGDMDAACTQLVWDYQNQECY